MKKVLAFDIGGTNTRLALFNENLENEKEIIVPTIVGDKEKFLSAIVDLINKFDLKDVVAIGAGVPGVVDREKSKIIVLPNMHIGDIDFGDFLKEKFGLPVYLRNDAEVACLGEAYSPIGRDYENVFFITISTGLGGALCVSGDNADYVTEIGHTITTYKNGNYEYEEIASGTGLVKLAKINGLEVKNAKELFDLIKAKDPKAVEIFADWKMLINRFITMVEDSYEPNVIFMTGGVLKNKDLFFDELVKAHPDTSIHECYYNDHAGLVGAAVYALRKEEII